MKRILTTTRKLLHATHNAKQFIHPIISCSHNLYELGIRFPFTNEGVEAGRLGNFPRVLNGK